jgi:hypothetical protein
MYNNVEKVEIIKIEAIPKDGLKDFVLPNKIERKKISESTIGVSFVVD